MLVIKMLQVITFSGLFNRESLIYYVLCVMANNKNQLLQIQLISLRSPFNVLDSVLVKYDMRYEVPKGPVSRGWGIDTK